MESTVLISSCSCYQCGYCGVGPNSQRKEDIRAETSGNEILCDERVFTVKCSHVASKSEPYKVISESLYNYTSATTCSWVAGRLFNIYCYHITHYNSASKKGVRDSSISQNTHNTIKNHRLGTFISAFSICYSLLKMNRMQLKRKSYTCR